MNMIYITINESIIITFVDRFERICFHFYGFAFL